MTSVAQYGFQSYIINQLGVQRQQMTNLEQQVSTGLQSQDFGGLGQNRSLAIDFQSQIDQANTDLNTINNASTSVNILNTSIQGIGDTATSMRANFAQQDYTLLSNGLTQQQQTAANGLEEVISTLNSNIGGDYVFGGKSTNAAPVTDLSTILDGTATQAGFNQVTAERLQADQGTANATTGQVLGRLQVTTPATNANAVNLTANGGVFGWQLSSVSDSDPTTGPALTQPTGGQGTLGVDFTNSTIGPGDTITVNLTGPDGTAEPVVLTAANVPAIVPGATSPAPPGRRSVTPIWSRLRLKQQATTFSIPIKVPRRSAFSRVRAARRTLPMRPRWLPGPPGQLATPSPGIRVINLRPRRVRTQQPRSIMRFRSTSVFVPTSLDFRISSSSWPLPRPLMRQSERRRQRRPICRSEPRS